MRIIKRPTEKIFDDAWYIADAMIRKADNEIFLCRAKSAYAIQNHTELIAVNTRTIAERLDRWATEHGGPWQRYLDGYPRYDRIQSILEREITK
jgi:hypothetical protein